MTMEPETSSGADTSSGDLTYLQALEGARHWMAYAISKAPLEEGYLIGYPDREPLLDVQNRLVKLIANYKRNLRW